MKEKLYNITKEQIDVVHFTREKIFCRIRSDQEDVNICWICDDSDFEKNLIVFSQLFNKKVSSNLRTNKESFIDKILSDYSEKELEYTKSIFSGIFNSESINLNQSYRDLMINYDEYFYISLFYFVAEKCKGNILKVNDIIISFKNTNEFLAVNFWDKYFK